MPDTAQITLHVRIRRVWPLHVAALVARVWPSVGRWLFCRVLGMPRLDYRTGKRWQPLGSIDDLFEVTC